MAKSRQQYVEGQDEGLAAAPPDVDVDVDFDQLRADRDAAKTEYEGAQARLTEAETGKAARDASVTYDPSRFVAIDASGNGVYEVLPLHDDEVPGVKGLQCDWPMDVAYRNRYIQVGSLMYEHVADVQGVWGYRHQG